MGYPDLRGPTTKNKFFLMGVLPDSFLDLCREEIKKKNNQIILLSTAANVYQTETGAANNTLAQLKEELNQVDR